MRARPCSSPHSTASPVPLLHAPLHCTSPSHGQSSNPSHSCAPPSLSPLSLAEGLPAHLLDVDWNVEPVEDAVHRTCCKDQALRHTRHRSDTPISMARVSVMHQRRHGGCCCLCMAWWGACGGPQCTMHGALPPPCARRSGSDAWFKPMQVAWCREAWCTPSGPLSMRKAAGVMEVLGGKSRLARSYINGHIHMQGDHCRLSFFRLLQMQGPLTGYTVPPMTRPRGYHVRSSNLHNARQAGGMTV